MGPAMSWGVGPLNRNFTVSAHTNDLKHFGLVNYCCLGWILLPGKVNEQLFTWRMGVCG